LAWAASPLFCSLKQLCANVQLYEEAGCAYLRPGRRANSALNTQRNPARHLDEADPQVHALAWSPLPASTALSFASEFASKTRHTSEDPSYTQVCDGHSSPQAIVSWALPDGYWISQAFQE
jgi:hypothetical protein